MGETLINEKYIETGDTILNEKTWATLFNVCTNITLSQSMYWKNVQKYHKTKKLLRVFCLFLLNFKEKQMAIGSASGCSWSLRSLTTLRPPTNGP